jgi:ribonuclease HI
MFHLYFDGAANPNPGPSSYGFVIYKASCPDTPIKEGREYIGKQTNNIAEYRGLIAGLEAAISIGIKDIVVHGDSLLVISQVTNKWKCKKPHLATLCHTVKSVISASGIRVAFVWIPRSQNARADHLAELALRDAAIPTTTVVVA